MRSNLSAAGLALIASTLAAQVTTIVPSKYATTEANAFTQYPLGATNPQRVQYLYSSSMVAVPAILVNRIGLRNEGNLMAPAKNGLDLEITMSGTNADPYRPSTIFAANHGPNPTTIFVRKLVNIPAVTVRQLPGMFTLFPLDVPFAYVRSAGNLVIDYGVHNSVTGTYAHDTSLSFPAVTTAIGTPCFASQSVADGAAVLPNSVLTFELGGGLPTGHALHLLGLRRLPTPIALPGGRCQLYQDVLAITPVTISNLGTGRISYPLQFEYFEATVLGQFLVTDASFSILDASQSHSVTIGGCDPQSRVYNLTSATASSGFYQVGIGIVTQLGS